MFRTTILAIAATAAALSTVLTFPNSADAGRRYRWRGRHHQMSGRWHQPRHHAVYYDNCKRSGVHRTTHYVSADAVTQPKIATRSRDIIDTAVGAGSFKTLVTAVKAAGLVETLKGKGPFTVFAPTDDAFAKLPKGTVESLLEPENKEKLQAILTYHVVPGRVEAVDVVNLTSAKTVNGQSVKIQVVDGTVKIDGAKVLKTDIDCTNGVIHVIDAVILPN